MIKPTSDNVLIKIIEDEIKTKSGIILTGNTSKDRPQKAEVVEVGKGRVNVNGHLIAVDIKPGDKVYVPQFAGHKIVDNEIEYILLKEGNIIAVEK